MQSASHVCSHVSFGGTGVVKTAESTPLLVTFLDFVGARGQELCQWRHLSWIAKPTERIAVDNPRSPFSFMPEALPVATLPVYLGTGYCWFWTSDFYTMRGLVEIDLTIR